MAAPEKYNDAKSTIDVAPVGETAIVPAGKVPALNDYRTVMVQRAIFQSLASMGLVSLEYQSGTAKSLTNTISSQLLPSTRLSAILDEP